MAMTPFLSIIIPSFNPQTSFFLWVNELSAERPDYEFVIVDDHSDFEIAQYLHDNANIRLIRHEESTGAGGARNTGTANATGRYFIYVDDDDYMHWPEIDRLCAKLDADTSIDFSISTYSRLLNGEPQPMLHIDRELFNAVLQGESERLVGIDGHEGLCRITNFPWTKVYRAGFVKRIGLRFSCTRVQNDVYGHWQSILMANKILVSEAEICTKIDNTAAGRVSNIFDLKRLDAYQAMRETYALVRDSRRPAVEAVFWQKFRDLSFWILSLVPDEHRAQFLRAHLELSRYLNLQSTDLLTHLKFPVWELWKTPSSEGSKTVSENPESSNAESGEHLADLGITMLEVSRLKALAHNLEAENIRLRQHIADIGEEIIARDCELQRRDQHIHDLEYTTSRKVVRLAMKLRAFVSRKKPR